MKCLLITSVYPDKKNPGRGAFVAQMAQELSSEGVDMSIIAPKSINNHVRDFRKISKLSPSSVLPADAPIYPSFSNKRALGLDFGLLSQKCFVKSAINSKLADESVDFYLGKFLLGGGAAAVELGLKFGRHSFIDLGESRLLEVMKDVQVKRARYIIQHASGITCVSQRLKDEAIALGADPGKVVVIPNRADPEQFKPMSKAKCRDQLGLDQNIKLVVFVGYFITRKGVQKVENSIRVLKKSGENVKGIFIGEGPLEPSADVCAFKGTLPHSELPVWLNAADVFCLPTLAEGNCNAINEAMNVGLPIVSSDIPAVALQLEKYSRSFLVDPQDSMALQKGLVEALALEERHGFDKQGDLLVHKSRGQEIADFLKSFLGRA